jgi:hypothetical protein
VKPEPKEAEPPAKRMWVASPEETLAKQTILFSGSLALPKRVYRAHGVTSQRSPTKKILGERSPIPNPDWNAFFFSMVCGWVLSPPFSERSHTMSHTGHPAQVF